MGRNKKDPGERAVKTTITLSQELLARVKAECGANRESLSGFIARALEAQLSPSTLSATRELRTLRVTVAAMIQTISALERAIRRG